MPIRRSHATSRAELKTGEVWEELRNFYFSEVVPDYEKAEHCRRLSIYYWQRLQDIQQ